MTNLIVREGARSVDTDQPEDSESEWSLITDLLVAVALVVAAFVIGGLLVGFSSAYWPRFVSWLSF